MEGCDYEGINQYPINGTGNGCLLNKQNQEEADSMRVRDTERNENLKEATKRGKDDEGRRPRP